MSQETPKQYNEDMNKYITKQIVESVGKNDFKNYDKDWSSHIH